jgi:hypothetical protein
LKEKSVQRDPRKISHVGTKLIRGRNRPRREEEVEGRRRASWRRTSERRRQKSTRRKIWVISRTRLWANDRNKSLKQQKHEMSY